jgi:hypothetical protein
LLAARDRRVRVGDEQAMVRAREDREPVALVGRQVLGERAQARLDGHERVAATEQDQDLAADLRHHRGGVEVENAPQEVEVGGSVVDVRDNGLIPGAVLEFGLFGQHRLGRHASPEPVGPGIDPDQRVGDGRLVVAFGAEPAFEPVALLLGRCHAGAGVADDEVDRLGFEGGGEQGDPSALADAVEPDRLAGRGWVGTQHPDGGERLVRPVRQGLVGPVPGRSSAAGFVVAQHDRPGVADPLWPAAPVVPVPVAGAVDEHDARERAGAVGRHPDDRTEISDRGGDDGLGLVLSDGRGLGRTGLRGHGWVSIGSVPAGVPASMMRTKRYSAGQLERSASRAM